MIHTMGREFVKPFPFVIFGVVDQGTYLEPSAAFEKVFVDPLSLLTP